MLWTLLLVLGWKQWLRRRLLHVFATVRATEFELLGLQPIDNHGEVALVSLHHRHLILDGEEICEDGVHGGLEVG